MTSGNRLVILLHRSTEPFPKTGAHGSADRNVENVQPTFGPTEPVPMPHWDWLFDLDSDQPLRTYSTPTLPCSSGPEPASPTPDANTPRGAGVSTVGVSIAWHRADHRRRYLTHRGPIRDGTSEVIEVATGTLLMDRAKDVPGSRLSVEVTDWRIGSACGDFPLGTVGRIEFQRMVERGEGRYQLRLFRG